jgi:transcriptional regulator with XRE-family HTH domain
MSALRIDDSGFGERLAAERSRLGFSQTEFALRLGIRRLTQSQYERGKTYPTVPYLKGLGALGADLSYILFEASGRIERLPLELENEVERRAFELLDLHQRANPTIPLSAEGQHTVFKLFRARLRQAAWSDQDFLTSPMTKLTLI